MIDLLNKNKPMVFWIGGAKAGVFTALGNFRSRNVIL
jgi:hypothetical protein